MNHSVKTPLFGTLCKVFRMAFSETEQEKHPASKKAQCPQEISLDRRRFLEKAGKTVLFSRFIPKSLLDFPKSWYASLLHKSFKPRIAIIGAGMAGLNTLHTLKKAGYDATIYEASGRVGGRIFSVQNAMSEGLWTEFGAEFIDTQHQDMLSLVHEFNLELMDFNRDSEQKLQKEAFFF